MYQGQCLSLTRLDNGLVELCFDNKNESVNKLNGATTAEMKAAFDALDAAGDVKGLLLTSAKPVFIVGADITEFTAFGEQSSQSLAEFTGAIGATFARLESFAFPSVVAINGFALGGGLEVCLCCDFRVMSAATQVGLPEVSLGLIPGWGGTVRLPRLVGFDTAVEWIATGAHQSPDKALKAGAVDAVAAPEQLRDAALDMLNAAVAGGLDYQNRRAIKAAPLQLNQVELGLAGAAAKAMVFGKAGKNYPAPNTAVDLMVRTALMNASDALAEEGKAFGMLMNSPQARAMIGNFLSDQFIGKLAKQAAKQAEGKASRAAVLGAGIMGGGIAYQNALKGVPVLMKDIAQASLDLGMNEATKLLAKRVERGALDAAKMGATLSRITPSLNYAGIENVDVVVEAVVENPKIKGIVLKEVEGLVKPGTVLASNTSTISITSLAKNLDRPQDFCGMHFFNPVHAMPLVEVIRGAETSDQTIAKVVAYAAAIGKKPIVVNDCPGFLVNRVLFPYFAGFDMLLRDGADFRAIDKVMEKFGWPMGPAYLMDVVGIDTGIHAAAVMAEGIPERMNYGFTSATQVMFDNNRYGQKNGAGYYVYETDKRGKPKKIFDAAVLDLIKPVVGEPRTFDDEEVVVRMMLPMATEMAHCLDEGIVATPAEADMALLYGVGFPPFRGGVCRWMDEVGMAQIVAWCDKYAGLGAVYQPTESMRKMAADGTKYYG